MNNGSFRRFPELPAELRLMVWELATSTQARALLVISRTGDQPGDLGLLAYTDGNWNFNPQLRYGVGETVNSEAEAVELTRYRTVDLVGDIVRAWLPEWTSVRPPVVVNFQRDLVYVALKPTHFAPLGIDNFRPLEGLGSVEWAPMVESLAVLIGDEPWSYWGGDLLDAEIRSMVQRLPALRRFWLVLSLAHFWPPGFDHGLRTDHGFLPVDLARQAAVWPWFEGEYNAEYSPLIGRISAIAAAEGRGELEVRLVFDVNHDGDYWFNHDLYRRYVNTW